MNTSYDELEKGGFIKQKHKDRYIMRIRAVGGNLTVDQLAGIIKLAGEYGRDYVHLTTRQGVEIPWVAFGDYENISRDLKQLGLLPGTCGPRVRTVMACPGQDACGFALADVRSLAAGVDAQFFGRDLPGKVKIGLSGCPNSCSKPQENDIGLVAAVEPLFDPASCAGCGLCTQVCPGGALAVAGKKPRIDHTRCRHEGNCITGCPVDAWQAGRVGYHLYLGGKAGRSPSPGLKVAEFIPADEVPATIEKILAAYTALAQGAERIGDVMARLGGETFRAAVLDGQLEEDKSEWAI